jgi:hypothetical protein
MVKLCGVWKVGSPVSSHISEGTLLTLSDFPQLQLCVRDSINRCSTMSHHLSFLRATGLASLIALCLLPSPCHAIRVVASPGSLNPDIPASCRASLATDIACGPRLITASDLKQEVPFNGTFLGEYCNSTCTDSIKKFSDGVSQRCGNTFYDFGGGTQQSGNMIALPLKWVHDVYCLTDGSELSFCLPRVIGNEVDLCDKCSLKYFAGLLSSPFGSDKIDGTDFSSLVSSCKAKPTEYPYSTTSLPVPASTSSSTPNITCWGGTEYTVQREDSCESIANAKSMAIDNLLYLNDLDYKCETLTVGSKLCIRDACKLHKVAKGETCKQIVSKNSFSTTELVQWNPILESGCSNMTSLEGRTICITPPGTDKYEAAPTASFGFTWTWPSGTWVAGPTEGVPLENATTDWVPEISATTMTQGSPVPSQYYENCPLNENVWDAGFEWEFINDDCKEMFENYCFPEFTTGPPFPKTTFPSSCFFTADEPTEEAAI